MSTESRSAHLFIKEWSDYRGLSDEKIGVLLGKDRTTIFKWRTQQSRLDPEKIADLADVLDCQPAELWRPPPSTSRPSVDAMLKDAPDELVQKAADVAAILLKTGQ